MEQDNLQTIYEAIEKDGFSERTINIINKLIADIENGRTNFSRFTQQEHAGLCKAGAPLIGASIVASYARRSLTTGSHAEGGEGSGLANWQIDELSRAPICIDCIVKFI